MPKGKISVIVPIYNSEKHLNKCIDSIINQSYHNLEIILVNDGSTDSSSKIIENYVIKDQRIVTIYKENGGIGSAYQVALEKVSGDYISFVDSDDYIDTEMYAELIKIAATENADIIQFGMNRFNSEGRVFKEEIPEKRTIEGNNRIMLEHFIFIRTPSLACRIFKSYLLKGVKFFPRSLGVDETTYIQIIARCKKYVLINKAYYYVYERDGSVSREVISGNQLRGGMMVHRFICDFILEKKKEYEKYAKLKYIKYLIGVWVASNGDKELLNSSEFTEALNDFKSYYNNVKKSNELKSEKMLFRFKLWVFNINPNIYVTLRALLKTS